MENGQTTPELTYDGRCARFGEQRDRYERQSKRNGDLNLLLFLGGLTCLGLGAWLGETRFYGAAGLCALALVAALAHHGRLRRMVRRYSALYDINDEARRRLRREWRALPELYPVDKGTLPEERAANGTAADLDLLGHASLEHLLGTPNTPVGKATLRRWILHAADVNTIRLRQEAAAELAPQIDWRDEISVRGRLMGEAQGNYERFMAWAEAGGWLSKRPWLLWAARLLPVATLALFIAQIRGAPTLPLLSLTVLAQAALAFTAGRNVAHEIDQVAEQQRVFGAYGEMFRLIGTQAFAARGLRLLQERLAASGLSAHEQMLRLGRLMPLADIRRWMFFFLIDIATLWSFHLLWLLERWQREAGGHVRAWLETLGETEALIALATLCHDQPGWAFPEVVEGEAPRLSARQLAHPLLPPAIAVGNDVEVGPPGTFLLVTGSNMSGKSTLLRAIGVNSVLAQMGGPVSAAEMRLPPLLVASSMRVQDSLEQGVSTYMAELRRLKEVVDLADEQSARHAIPVLYLLDEILQGTNTAERQIAARWIIRRLVAAGAIGAVSTHDLGLIDAPEIAALAVPVHFTENFTRGPEGPTMTFDYRLRPGIATSTNALKLMELIGLVVGERGEA